MKKVLVCLAVLALATAAFGQNTPELNDHGNGNGHGMEVQGWAKPGGGHQQNLVYHTGGAVIRNARVVMIFWGTFPSGYTTELQNFRNQFGMTGEYNTITQYSGEDAVAGAGNINLTNLAAGTPDWFDPSTPPTNVTDAIVQSKVQAYLASNAFDNSTIYEVFIPSTSYSSDGNSTSCGGPNLAYCAYHGHFSYLGHDVKYSIEPFPSCSGCSANGFNTNQNQEHFVCHETREAVTDADLNAWFDRSGAEADDKCAWSPAPFLGTGGFGYQYEWSNANSACVRTR
jgi:hypothetical protein